ncbi:aldose 1-epimerase family protein [Leucobacter weissii]|uniref:Aldose 1-epimerase family protein n=1 Tax=Leucobacter weissii TaxID=1983706 RepID=A0A939MI63_9MICO|nr:aldose 1-epimerase family protein [Leucobacter weissii]MBO1901036.1 aldose 1-epimerase family protein [Leucobacter weissii]
MSALPTSGSQHSLRHGDYSASVASVGASLRSLVHAGRDLVVPFDADEVRPAYRGATLVPWPNRVVDGTYSFDGADHRLPLTEPQRAHALHGLGSWLAFDAVDEGADFVTLEAVIQPQAGYPWRIGVSTTYSLGPEGLTQLVRARNESSSAAPFGTAPHPYLVAGSGPVDEWTLELPAERMLTVTAERLIPDRLVPVPEALDFRAPRTIGATEIDHAYTDLARDDRGTVAVRVRDAAGGGVEVTWDAACAWVQIHTADLSEGPSHPGHRSGLAVEPMTCAPDAFNAARYPFDTGLIVIEPGETAVASWRISELAPDETATIGVEAQEGHSQARPSPSPSPPLPVP